MSIHPCWPTIHFTEHLMDNESPKVLDLSDTNISGDLCGACEYQSITSQYRLIAHSML